MYRYKYIKKYFNTTAIIKNIQYVYAYAYVFITHQAMKLLNKENKAKPHVLHHACIFKEFSSKL